MKKKYCLVLSVLILPALFFGCAGPPTLSKSAVVDTMSLTVVGTPQPSLAGTGAFYDYSQPSTVVSGGVTSITSYTATAITYPGGPWSFSDMTHDTLGFSITITGVTSAVTFGYQLDGVSGTAIVNPPGYTYTSGRISF